MVLARRFLGLSFVLLILCGLGLVLVVDAAKPGQTISGAIRQSNVPVVITNSGSYYLEENLTVSDSAAVAVILIDAHNVTLDLRGFTISGPGASPTCNTSNAGFGVNATVRNNVTVRNGNVEGFCNVGVHLPGTNNRVEGVKVVGTGGDGIFVGINSVVSGCQVWNSSSGVNTDAGSRVIDNSFFEIMGHAIGTSGGSPVSPAGGVIVTGNSIRCLEGAGTGIYVQGTGNRLESNTIELCSVGIELTGDSESTFYGRNFLQGNSAAVTDGGTGNVDAGVIDAALSNTVIPLAP